jgi:outer membrane protein insertion porin family
MTLQLRSITSSLAAILLAGGIGCAGRAMQPVNPLTRAELQSFHSSAVSPPVIRAQSPSRYDEAPAVYDTNSPAPGTNGLTRGPMRVSGEVQQVQFEQGPPVAPPPGSGVANGGIAPNNAAFLPPGGGQPLPPPPDAGPFINPAWSPAAGPETVLPPTTDLDVYVDETQTGRFMFGVGVNSDAGVSGQIVVDERNFNLLRWPTSFEDFANGTAFRGAGQGFRLEASPGTQVQRYLFTFTEPYLFYTDVSLSTSGFFFNRVYRDYEEERLGGRLGLGYRLASDLSIATAFRAENVNISNPRVPGVQALDSVIGDNELYSGRVSLTHDTRDLPFAPTQGHFFDIAYEQAFGDFDFPRGEVDVRKYYLLRERPDTSGRHTLGLSAKIGISGEDTPIFENYFAGGYSSLRGFNFRGAAPTENGVEVGGRFRFLGSAEYMFPLTADDMIKGVMFCDFGTVERDIEINSENFRVAPGFGIRIMIPALGPAPLAFDFAVPVAHAPGDNIQNFSFFFGFGR